MLTSQDNFRLGFLLRCAEEGCTPEEISSRVKVASSRLCGEKTAVFMTSAKDLKDILVGVGTLPLHLGGYTVLGGAALGGAGGYGLAKLQDSKVDPKEAKREELIAAYKLQTEKARKNLARRSYRAPVPKSPQLF